MLRAAATSARWALARTHGAATGSRSRSSRISAAIRGTACSAVDVLKRPVGDAATMSSWAGSAVAGRVRSAATSCDTRTATAAAAAAAAAEGGSQAQPHATGTAVTVATPSKEEQQAIAAQHGFSVVTTEYIPEFSSHVTLLQHSGTGAQVISVAAPCTNKLFGIAFRTPVPDSTGVAHILEHSVLGGSRKYPVKEPFAELLRSSLHTYLNAFTYPDRTCYPVASQNLKDFYNLVDVYLDAVLQPRLSPLTFQQEGWHLRLGAEADGTPLKYGGVVYNEMKGVFSSSDALYEMAGQQALFPDVSYVHCSGGAPPAIPDLTFEQFKDFHRRFYHPGNSLSLFYGDDDLNARLAALKPYFDAFANIPAQPPTLQLQQRFQQPKQVDLPYPAPDEDAQHMVGLHWVLSPSILDQQTLLGLHVLGDVLLGNSAAPLTKALLESGLGDDLVGEGMEMSLAQVTFGAGLKGVEEGNVAAVQELVLSTLQQLADTGLDHEAIEASLNSLEFRMREPTGPGMGMPMFLAAVNSWMYRNDPLSSLHFEIPMQRLRQKLREEPKYLDNLLRTLLCENPHRVTMHMFPDRDMAARLEKEEQDKLTQLRGKLSQEQLAELAKANAALDTFQTDPDAPEALAALPKLKLADIPTTPLLLDYEVKKPSEGLTNLIVEQPTNDIVYYRMTWDMSHMPAPYLSYMALFCRCLRELPTLDSDDVKIAARIGTHTGGVGFSTSVTPKLHSPDSNYSFMMHGKALSSKVHDMTAIMSELLLRANFDNKARVSAMVKEMIAGMEEEVVTSGHSVVRSHIVSALDPSGWVEEQMGGVSALEALRMLEARIESDWPSVLGGLNAMREMIVTSPNVISCVTGDEKTLMATEKPLKELVSSVWNPVMPSFEVEKPNWPWHQVLRGPVGFAVQTQVNFVGVGARMYEHGQAPGWTQAVMTYLSTKHLWDQVRVRGSAYGAFANLVGLTGLITFGSYRDPHLTQTLDTFMSVPQHLRDVQLTQDEISNIVISTVGSMDGPVSPGTKGAMALTRYIAGATNERLTRQREQLLGTNLQHFREFANLLEPSLHNAVQAAVASDASLRSMRDAKKWTIRSLF